MEIKRDKYLQTLIDYMWDGQVKVITGIRRCGKSYLLRTLFKNYLLNHGVKAENIISIELDLAKDIKFRNPLELASHVRELVENNSDQFYLFVDEIQMSDKVANPYNLQGKEITFYDALNDLKELSNLDIYVTGSNSKMLSSDILTEFRGRSDEIRVHPLSFAEYYSAVGGDKNEAFENYSFFGGYENSERKVLGLFFDNVTDFPVSAIEFHYRNCDKLTHRDFLGALMSLGIERETVGDILVEDGRTIVFVKSELKEYIISQIFKIGNVGVKITEANLDDLPQGRGFEENFYTVSSLRLDNIISAITGLSREKTKTLILSGSVSLNFISTQNVSCFLKDGDTLTVRGKGKYVLNGILGETRKGRIKISVIHFR